MSQYIDAIQSIKKNKPVLVFDYSDREGETDIVYPARKITMKDIKRLRKDAGGLICVAIPSDAAERMNLLYASEILEKAGYNFKNKLPYDERSSFSIWVNHKDTYTGITDKDRSLTARKISESINKSKKDDFKFEEEFRSPGHVPILRAAKNLVKDRKGQTELSIALAKEADIQPAMVLSEMLGENGDALPKEKAKKYASKNNIPFLEGKEIVEKYNK
ncbi:MAG: 34-dihydroxy-2-butanone 4-phosphate synthase [Candidatus Methanohalarchaeum thermophilum]|uniref:3,4-dihydroxy-2-butanone 4-phosphate synthase n=1 Tax=Methanohalarchaeum thermophilum TaxID=1903181 RepID=A0A1Q6DV73_METT1|nr:MAG: 34-dihydroxy-2-butanone 4-phosphate synthase [Candidatus Methanohalarchaeum thermophilum]